MSPRSTVGCRETSMVQADAHSDSDVLGPHHKTASPPTPTRCSHVPQHSSLGDNVESGERTAGRCIRVEPSRSENGFNTKARLPMRTEKSPHTIVCTNRPPWLKVTIADSTPPSLLTPCQPPDSQCLQTRRTVKTLRKHCAWCTPRRSSPSRCCGP